MNAEETLIFWRENLSCEEHVKRQLADEYANAGTKEEIKLLNEIWKLVYENEP